MRRAGTGGGCPACDEPITIAELTGPGGPDLTAPYAHPRPPHRSSLGNSSDRQRGIPEIRSNPVLEANWSPLGHQSGLCAGLAVAGLSGDNVTLQRCGATSRTLWIGDDGGGGGTSSGGHDYVPWVNGSDAQFSHPLVLTIDADARRPADQLKVGRENLLTGGVTDHNQEFTIVGGAGCLIRRPVRHDRARPTRCGGRARPGSMRRPVRTAGRR